jgi:predicted sulfurtransferase
LQKLDTVGRIYLAPDTGIGGINAQLSVPVHQVSAVQSVFYTLSQFNGVSFEYNYGMKDTEKPSFRSLKVLRKPHVCWLLLHCNIPLNIGILLHATKLIPLSTVGGSWIICK